MQKRLQLVVLAVLSACCAVIAVAARAESPRLRIPPRWPAEKARAWYRQQGWIVGFNYVPSTACNTTEFWQAGSFDPRTIDRELGWAEGLGYNSARVFVQYVVWKADPEGFKQRFERFLQLADKHHLTVMPVFFDDCAFGSPAQLDPYPGKQREPIPGMILPSWTPSPGRKLGLDTAEWPVLKRYVRDLVAAHRTDQRIIIWDLYNEPMNRAKVGISKAQVGGLKFLESAFLWAREAEPSQPITVSVWSGPRLPGYQLCLRQSDVISFHLYGNAEALKKRIAELNKLGRPVVNTEWMARAMGGNFATDLPIFKAAGVGCYQWGLVNGRTQAQFPWWNKPGGKIDPKTGWFHDIFHPDGTPYRPEEIDVIKRLLKQHRDASQG